MKYSEQCIPCNSYIYKPLLILYMLGLVAMENTYSNILIYDIIVIDDSNYKMKLRMIVIITNTTSTISMRSNIKLCLYLGMYM